MTSFPDETSVGVAWWGVERVDGEVWDAWRVRHHGVLVAQLTLPAHTTEDQVFSLAVRLFVSS